MKIGLLRTVVTLASAAIALLAPSAANAATSTDNVRASRLTPLLGDWTCSDTGSSKPYTASVKSQGSWILWRDTGEDSNTLYIRWNRSMERYVVATIDVEGDLEVSTTSQADPLNATWQVRFPERTSGPTFTVRYSGGIFSLERPYVNRKGKRADARLSGHSPKRARFLTVLGFADFRHFRRRSPFDGFSWRLLR